MKLLILLLLLTGLSGCAHYLVPEQAPTIISKREILRDACIEYEAECNQYPELFREEMYEDNGELY